MNTIHLYVGPLQLGDEELARAMTELSPDECERASRFKLQEHRHRFVASHSLLRRVVARHCGVSNAAIAWVIESFGKPVLAVNPLGIHFSLSHAGDWAAIAVSCGLQVGVDIELCRPALFAKVGSMLLGPQELLDLQTGPQSDPDLDCLRYWVAKEAFLKLNGVGLHVDPLAVRVDQALATATCHHPAIAIPNADLHWIDSGDSARCAVAVAAGSAARIQLATGFD